MSRTRGASRGAMHMDDGELVDKEGKPLNPIAHRLTDFATPVVLVDRGTSEPDLTAPQVSTEQVNEPEFFHCTMRTISRNIEGWEAVQLVDILLGGIQSQITAEKYRALSADIRRHFMRGPLPE